MCIQTKQVEVTVIQLTEIVAHWPPRKHSPQYMLQY